MKRKQFLVFLGLTVTSLLLILGLRLFSPSPVVTQSNANLLVSAAASLKEVLEEIKPIYHQSQPNVNISYNFGASGALQQQIEQGAPADIFISAGKKQVDTLEQKGLVVPETRTNLANNRLVLILPKNGVTITGFSELKTANIKKIAIGEPRSVPAGQYAEQVLKKLAIYNQVQSKLVFANNVRQVLAVVESGNADAGLVYATDARVSQNVRVVVAADAQDHAQIVYPAAVIKRSQQVSAAKGFLQFLSSNEAKTIFKKYGFIVSF